VTEIIVVGAGISAAAACAELKQQFKITVFEQRPHIGGNCYDYSTRGTFVHAYGCHIYHNPNQELHEWLSKYTEWVPYQHRVTAEISPGVQVPFPYSKATEAALGGTLSDEEIISTFFRGYSEKMWGKRWEELPASIRNRVPKRQEISDFFPDQITALPKKGYTHLIENMFDGCDMVLGAHPMEWTAYAKAATFILYCGRLDLLRTPGGLPIGGELVDPQAHLPAWLHHITLDFMRSSGPPVSPTGVLNYCHTKNQAIRRVQHAQITGGYSDVYHMEIPQHSDFKGEIAPTYPAPRTPDTARVLTHLKTRARQLYPNLHPLGRLASHQYLDIFQAVAAGRKLGLELLAGSRAANGAA